MALTPAEVAHVARLARMRLEEQELERMGQQISAILDYMSMLQEVDVADVPITAQVTGLTNVSRPDASRPSLPPAKALANAPDQQDQFFKVKAVFEDE